MPKLMYFRHPITKEYIIQLTFDSDETDPIIRRRLSVSDQLIHLSQLVLNIENQKKEQIMQEFMEEEIDDETEAEEEIDELDLPDENEADINDELDEADAEAEEDEDDDEDEDEDEDDEDEDELTDEEDK